ncbi:hypothetical protein AAF712_015239 [Marasmius tenuissimus]|uniref:Uncharacterized protein n=1 Tax=Marasmius tenuissimus TaxID=585030 RepID=A0ABR2ZBC4_9AGAR
MSTMYHMISIMFNTRYLFCRGTLLVTRFLFYQEEGNQVWVQEGFGSPFGRRKVRDYLCWIYLLSYLCFSSLTSKAVTTPRNKSKKDSGSSVDDAGVAALSSRVATVEESIAAMRQQLLDLHTSYDSNHVAILRMIADLKPSEPINLDVVDRLEELWNMLAETRVSMQSLSSSLGTMLPCEEFE